jgi:ATP adenylyltransferase/5',5'''-P-1,P-4-tetraphosphate phosphorylase II
MVSKEFKSQYTHLNLLEISELIVLQNFINGIVFFNGGKKSGASQPRKHIQAIPLDQISKEEFGIFKIFKQSKNEMFEKVPICNFPISNNDEDCISISNYNNLSEYFEVLKIKKFEENCIPHLFVDLTKLRNYFDKEKFEDILTDNLEEYAKIVYCIYLNVLQNLNLIANNNYIEKKKDCDLNRNTEIEDLEKILSDYSFLYTKDWLYVIPRKTDCVEMKNGNLYLNSNSFIFSILIKSDDLEKEIEDIDIIKDVYTKL